VAKKSKPTGHAPIHLPQEAESVKCGPVRISKKGAWRAAILILVYVVIAIHIVHWKVAGRTITPVEPSESMQTLELGYVNAGIILFIVLILSTLVFGRFFCGWGCHVVALQDLCGWLLKKLGMKPKPFRSRLLVYIPLFAAFYMFVLPTLMRLYEGRVFPGITYHLTTDNFWATFPTPGIAILTFLVCGFLIVWLVGNKGFCTYGCPYGALFYYADKAAPGKIRVTDDCEQCGHCTAVCTSNVRVHEEVKRYKMVVDAGCMKCMDCVSVCPKNALYFGFGKLAIGARPSTPAAKKQFDFSWAEEITMALLFLFSLYAFRGLYDAVPLLLAVGLSSIVAFLAIMIARLFYANHVRLQSMQLKSNGEIKPIGYGALLLGALCIGFLIHSAAWTYHFHEGKRRYATAMEMAANNPRLATELAASAIESYEWCAENGLFSVSTVEAAIGSSYAFNGQLAKGEQHLLTAVKLGPELANAWVQLGRTQAMSGKADVALETFNRALDRDPNNIEASHQAGLVLVRQDKPVEALPYLERAVRSVPNDPDLATDYGLALAAAGRRALAIEQLVSARQMGAGSAADFNLGLVLAEDGRIDEARTAFAAALKKTPNLPAANLALARLEFGAKKYTAAVKQAESVLSVDPYQEEALAIWAEGLQKSGGLESEILRLIRSRPEDEISWYRAAVLYRQKGDVTTARSLFSRLLSRNPNLPPPK
jgi:polyferredoxin/Tfp pilus assembly protein PilF